jgi:hypothetical protein
MRTIIDLPDTDRERLDSLCRQRGLSRAEGLRQSVFGLWRNRPEDSLSLERTLRSEWER